jgi:hypothetical protein
MLRWGLLGTARINRLLIPAIRVADMEDAALGLRPPRISLADSRMHIATIAALYRAASDQPSRSSTPRI